MKHEDAYYKLIQRIPKEQIKIDEMMCNHTSFKIGGPADYMILPTNIDALQYAVGVCKKYNIPYHIIGNGSNLLVKDGGIRGIVIKLADNFSKVQVDGPYIKAQSGVLLSTLSKKVVEYDLSGFEFASGIPGTLGGAITMNAGAYGGEMKDILIGVTVMDQEGRIIYLDEEDLDLGYRTSMIQKNDWVVLEGRLKLEKGERQKIKSMIKDLTKRRTTKQPLALPSAGSTFKRPVGYYAGKLIEDAGLKGVRVGGAQVSPLHAGFVVNVENACAKDVLDLIDLVQKTVKDEFGVRLEPEVRIMGVDI